MNNKKQLISESFLFKGTDYSTIDKKLDVTEKASVAEYKATELILSSEKHTDAVCIIDEGKIRIASNTGERDTVLRYAGRGETFGAATLFSTLGHSTRVYAETDTRVIFISKDLICKIISDSKEVALNYIEFLSDRISFLNRKVAAFTAATAEIKLAIYIYGNSDENGYVSCKTSMSKLADQLGIGRASLYRAIDLLVSAGIIEYNGKSFNVISRDSLYKIIK